MCEISIHARKGGRRSSGHSWPEQILALKKIQKYRWPEYYISGRSIAGAFRKWLDNLEKDTSERIT